MANELCGMVEDIAGGSSINLSQFSPEIVAEMRTRILARPELLELVAKEVAKLGRSIAPSELEEIRRQCLKKQKAGPVARRLRWLQNVERLAARLRSKREAAANLV